MHRRAFIVASAATPALMGFGAKADAIQVAERTPVGAWRQFVITTKVTLQNSSGQARLRSPLAQTAAGYQTAIDVEWQSNGRAELYAIQLMARRYYAAHGTKARPRSTLRSGRPSQPATGLRCRWCRSTKLNDNSGWPQRRARRLMVSCARRPSVSLTVARTLVSGCAPSMTGWWTRPGATPTPPAAVSVTSRQCFNRPISAASASISMA